MNEQPDKFQFTFFIRGILTVILGNAPDGWLKTKITFKTDTTYKAIRRSLTVPLKFVRKGAYLIRNEIYSHGLAGFLIYLTVGKLNTATRLYDPIYNGKLDPSKGEDAQTSYTVDSISADFTVQLDAYDETAFTLPLTGPDVLQIELPTLALSETCDFIMEASPDFRSNAFFAMSIVNYQQFADQASVKDTGFLAQAAPNFQNLLQNTWFFKARIATKVRIYGGMGISVSSGSYQLNICRSSDGSIAKTI